MMNKRQVSHTEFIHACNWDKTEMEQTETEESAPLVNIGLRHWWSYQNEAKRSME